MTPLRALLPTALLALVASALAAPATTAVAVTGSVPASTNVAPKGPGVSSRGVTIEVGNSLDSTIPCLPGPDGKLHMLRGRLVGPTKVLDGYARARRVNVLVHDAGTGAWFWNFKRVPSYDYATQLAKRGETSLVVDRLGYGRSPLKNGNATCVSAQVHMLHQVVTHLTTGNYDYTGSTTKHPPVAENVVVHGHGLGATIAQLEAERYSDLAGLVLIAPQSASPTRLAMSTLRDQGVDCLTGAGFAPFGATGADFKKLLFKTAPSAVQRAATAQRNSTPCGEVAGLGQAVLTAGNGTLDMPVLVLRGGADARNDGAVKVSTSKKVTRHTIKGAGSALVLEKSAGKTRGYVTAWLDELPSHTE